MDYKVRIVDSLLDLKLEAFGATLIKGPKGCGKTTSAKQKAKSFVAYFKEEKRKAKIRKGLKAERISRYSGHYPLYVTKPCCVTYRDNDTEWTKYGDTVTNTLTGENRFYEW